jgi:hypothetical protein
MGNRRGGQMSRRKVGDIRVAEQKKKDAAAKRRARSGKATATAKTDGKKNGEGVPDEVPVDLEDYKGARKKLRHAVKAVVKVKSQEIARKLVSKVEAGDMRGTEMVLSLMDKKKQDTDGKKKKKRSGPSWAELLASEPEWDESMEDDGGTNPAVVSGQ